MKNFTTQQETQKESTRCRRPCECRSTHAVRLPITTKRTAALHRIMRSRSHNPTTTEPPPPQSSRMRREHQSMASMHARTHAAKHAPTRRHHRSVQAGTSETSRVQLNPPQEPEPTKPPQIPPSKNKPLPTLPLRLRLYTARTRKKRDWIRRSEREEIPSRQSPVAHEAAGRRERRRVAYTLGPIRTGKEEEEEAGGGSAAAPRGRRRRGEARSSASLPLLWRRWSGWGAGGGGGGVWGWGTQVVEWSAQRRGGKGNSFSAVLHDKRWRTGEKYAEMTLLTPLLPSARKFSSIFHFSVFPILNGTPVLPCLQVQL